MDHITGSEKHIFDDDDDDDDEEEEEDEDDDDEDDDDDDDDDVRHFGDDGFDDEYDEDSWSVVGEEDIRPEESASRSRGGPSRSRPFPPVRDPPRPKARGKFSTVVDPPQGPPPPGHRGGRSRPHRPPRPRSVADHMDDEYPYGRPGQLPFHPAAQWAGVGLGYPGGNTATKYVNPFVSRSLTYLCSTDPFSPYGGGNPFADDYFGPRGRNSYRGAMARNNEVVPFPGYPPYAPYPPPFGPYMYPFVPSPALPPSNKSTPAPPPAAPAAAASPPAKDPPREDPGFKEIKQILADRDKREEDRAKEEAKAKELAKRQAEEDKLEALRKLIEKHNKEQLDREDKAKKDAEAKAKAAADEKKAAEEKEKELKEAAKKAKEDAEKEAKKKADEEKEKFDKQMEEAKKKAAELEAAKKKVEEENKKLKPGDDMLKPPIKFKDAVGRKFSFPWHLCKTWRVSSHP